MFAEVTQFVKLKTRDARLLQACANCRPVALCREDHDRFALGDGAALHLGVRPRDTDMCSADKQPTPLLPAVLTR